MNDWTQEIRERLKGLRLAPAREAEIVEEFAQHLEDRYDELLALGNSPETARQISLAELNASESLALVLQRAERRPPAEPIIIGERGRFNMIAGIWQDLRYSIRSLTKKPGFAAILIATLALGIGANTALFSIVNGVLLNPMPFPQPEQLVTFHQSKPNFDTGAIPFPNFRDLQKENSTFSSMSVSRGFGFSLIGAGEPERVNARLITSDYFTALGVQPMLGRNFVKGEDEAGVEAIAQISHSLWQRKFGSAPDIIGKGMTLDDKSYTIIGVLPANFTLVRNADVFVPIGQWNNPALKGRRAALGLHGIGRLKPGVTVAQAEADLNRVMANLAVLYPDTNRNNGSKVVALKERVVGDIGPNLWMLFAAVGFVLLIVCVNVSNLLLARSTGRAREFAIRAALGASRWRMVRQSLIESLLLAIAGGAVGLVIAGWGTKVALKLLPTSLPRADEVGLDRRVLLFTVGVSLFAGILSGLVPALKVSQWRLSETLKEGGRGSSGRGRAQGIFVAVEMALALVLLIGAGLMLRSLSALWKVDPGFKADNLMTYGLSLNPTMRANSAQAIRSSLRNLGEQIKTTPGVMATSFSAGAAPLQGEDDLFFWREDQPKPASQSEMSMSLVYRVEPGYLATMGIPLKQGRFFSDLDDERAENVVVVDEVFAQKYYANTSPVGKRIFLDGDTLPRPIIGVVGHVEQWGIDPADKEVLEAQLYEPFRQLSDDNMTGLAASVGVMTRFQGMQDSGLANFAAIRNTVQKHDGQNVIFQAQTMNEVIAGTLAQRRFSLILLDAFALAALLLASIGLYGVISYIVGQRTHELGIRLALGAQRATVMRLVLGQGMKMALAGVALGLFAALGLTRLMSRMVFGISATDPVTFAVISLLLTAVALLACIVPALRATKVDPLVALRYE
jgi:predicted permease